MNINLREVICTSRVNNPHTFCGHAVIKESERCSIWLDLGLDTCPFVQDGDKFWRMPECYIRGSTIKYLRIPDEIIDMVKEEVVSKGRGRGGMQQNKQQGKGRGGGAGRGKMQPVLPRRRLAMLSALIPQSLYYLTSRQKSECWWTVALTMVLNHRFTSMYSFLYVIVSIETAYSEGYSSDYSFCNNR